MDADVNGNGPNLHGYGSGKKVETKKDPDGNGIEVRVCDGFAMVYDGKNNKHSIDATGKCAVCRANQSSGYCFIEAWG